MTKFVPTNANRSAMAQLLLLDKISIKEAVTINADLKQHVIKHLSIQSVAAAMTIGVRNNFILETMGGQALIIVFQHLRLPFLLLYLLFKKDLLQKNQQIAMWPSQRCKKIIIRIQQCHFILFLHVKTVN